MLSKKYDKITKKHANNMKSCLKKEKNIKNKTQTRPVSKT